MMYLVMKLRMWDTIELEAVGFLFPFPVAFVKPEKELGYCPVFDKYEDALEYAGTASLVLAVEALHDVQEGT